MKSVEAKMKRLWGKSMSKRGNRFESVSKERTVLSMNNNLTRRAKPAFLMIGTATIALLAAIAVPNFATAHTTMGQSGASYLFRGDQGMNYHSMVNPKIQLMRLIANNMRRNGVHITPTRQNGEIASQIRPDVWAGSVPVMAQTVF